MLNFKNEVFEVADKKVLLTSWLDKDKKVWRALAPRFLGIIHDWQGVQGATREQALAGLKVLLRGLIGSPPGSGEWETRREPTPRGKICE